MKIDVLPAQMTHGLSCIWLKFQEWCSPWSPMRRFMPKLMVSVLTISFSPSASGAISSTTFLGLVRVRLNMESTWTAFSINKLEVWIVDLASIFFFSTCWFPWCNWMIKWGRREQIYQDTTRCRATALLCAVPRIQRSTQGRVTGWWAESAEVCLRAHLQDLRTLLGWRERRFGADVGRGRKKPPLGYVVVDFSRIDLIPIVEV